jgi:ribosomal protein L37AE/L43A
MYPSQDKSFVVVKKGFFSIQEFLESWTKTQKSIGDNTPVVFHFRISTGGLKDKNNCHPHSIAKDLAFCHNGILHNVTKDSKVSDTIQYRDKYLTAFSGSILSNKGVFDIIADQIGTFNKFVFLNSVGDVAICNESMGVWRNGLWFSNEAFRSDCHAGGFLSWPKDNWSWVKGKYVEDPEYWRDRKGNIRTDKNKGKDGQQDSKDYDDFPLKYDIDYSCSECGSTLKSAEERNIGTCHECGINLYGRLDWQQYCREADWTHTPSAKDTDDDDDDIFTSLDDSPRT